MAGGARGKKQFLFILLLAMACMSAGCAMERPPAAGPDSKRPAVGPEGPEPEKRIVLTVDDREIDVLWEKNEAVAALKDSLADQAITIETERHGGFEQVGLLPRSFPQNDQRITTGAGDIVLYGGDSIALFYGANTWEYTKLGQMEHLSAEEIRALLDTDGTRLTVSLE